MFCEIVKMRFTAILSRLLRFEIRALQMRPTEVRAQMRSLALLSPAVLKMQLRSIEGSTERIYLAPKYAIDHTRVFQVSIT